MMVAVVMAGWIAYSALALATAAAGVAYVVRGLRGPR